MSSVLATFLKDSTQMLIWRAAVMSLGVITAILLARWLGPEARGELALLIISISFCSLIVQFGIPQAMIYVLGAELFSEEEVLSTLIVSFFGVLIITAPCAHLLLIQLFDFSHGESGLVLFTVALSVFVALFRHLLLARKQFLGYNASVFIEPFIYLNLGVALWTLNRLSVFSVLVAYAFSLSVSLGQLLWWERSIVGNVFVSSNVKFVVLVRCIRHSIHLFIAGIGGFGMQRINYFLLEWLSGTRTVGLFAAASTIPNLFANLPQQLSTVLYTHISSSEKKVNDPTLTIRAFQLLSILCLLIIIPIGFFAEPLALLLFGPAFSGIGVTIVILTVGASCLGLAGLFFNALAGLGWHHYGSYQTGISLFLLCVLGYPLIQSYGLEGSAYAYAVTNGVNLILMCYLFCSKTNTRFSALLSVPSSDLQASIAWLGRRA